MTSLSSSSVYSPTGLVRPPARRALRQPGSEPINIAPPAGAGSAQPLNPEAPITDPNALPFGNGVSPVSGISPWHGTLPINIAPNEPMTPAGLPAAPANDADLGNTLITGAKPNVTPILGNGDAGPSILPGNDPRLATMRGYLDKSVGDLANTDRRSMLSSLLNDFDSQQREADDNAYTQSGRFSAKFGRLGSAMAAQDINNITRQSMADRNRFRNTLAADTIDKEIGDRFGKTNLFRGLAGDEYGYGASDRGEARGERSWNYGVGQDSRAEARGERAYGDQRNDLYRDELRGERGYQDTRAQQDLNNRITQAELQDRLTGSSFDRNLQRYNTGRQGNPSTIYAGAAGDYGAQGDATMQALQQYLQSLGIGAGSRG